MSAKVTILGTEATVQNGKWSCDDADILGYLEERARYLGNSPSIPDIDQFLAEDAQNIGAIIVQHSDRPPAPDDGTVY